jgi:L-fuculose-phosphate aldolase
MDQQKAWKVREEVCETAKKMSNTGLTAGTWGNISGRIDEEYMVVTPSGMNYEKMTPDQMAIVNMETLEWVGPHKPSIEVPLHRKIYLSRPEIGGIVHTHSQAALTVACARKEIPAISEDQVQILGGSIRCSAYVKAGSQELADSVEKALEGRMGALMANHGAVALGRNVDEALTAAVLVEKTARIYLDVQAIGGAVRIPEEDCAYYHKFFLERYRRLDDDRAGKGGRK